MFQDFALFPHLTIAQNVSFGLRRLSQAEKRAEALAVLERVGLARLADAYPATLSGGEQQRVALARAILPRPRVMLMDEPFSGLDVQLREQLQGETLKLLGETRATCLMVTHSPDEAMRMADRIAVMRGGRVVQVGRAEDLYRNPADLFVARLFSEINEIGATVSGGAIQTPIGRFAVPDLAEGEAARLCIRRGSIRVVDHGSGSVQGDAAGQRPSLAARVLRRRFLGDVMWVELAVDGFEQPLSMSVAEDQAPEPGREISVHIDPAGVLVFPAQG
jgi:iron(III) transport system ATP-binding protein